LTSQALFRATDDPERITTTRVRRWNGAHATESDDALAVEEPLEIFLGSTPLAVVMRTPGHDDELAAGFLYGEGIVRSGADLLDLLLWQDEQGRFAQNRVTIRLAADRSITTEGWQRQFFATSSCGMCGKASIDAVMQLAPPLERRLEVGADVLYALPDRLQAAQDVFARTGGLHAAGLFDLQGNLLHIREDIGRHNAVDKLIGRALLDNALPLADRLLVVSGRVSFEILQKALVARLPVLAAVSAPSSLAVAIARRCNITLVGFLRDGRMNVYA